MAFFETDLAVVGAGAAGLMTAISAGRARNKYFPSKESPPRIVLFDSRTKIGAKILISGGTRCNVTNRRVVPADYNGGPRHIVKHVLEAFTPGQTMDFFESIGVKLVLEPTGKYFPETHSGRTVLEALVKETDRLGIELLSGIKITNIRKEAQEFLLEGKKLPEGSGDFSCRAKRVVVCTGGLSYPETGSDGEGLRVAERLGHPMVWTSPALTPLLSDDEFWKSLSGISVEARLSFYAKGRKAAQTRDALLFTHFGYSGPAALDISRHFVRAKTKDRPSVQASFLPDETEESLGHILASVQKSSPKKTIKNFLIERFGFPERFVEIFLKKAGLEEGEILSKMKRLTIGRAAHLLLNCPLNVTGGVGYKKAEVTAGGVDLSAVRQATMESKKVPGLYFAGEILDMDGRIGGFNFQWAWSSGWIAGESAVRSLR